MEVKERTIQVRPESNFPLLDILQHSGRTLNIDFNDTLAFENPARPGYELIDITIFQVEPDPEHRTVTDDMLEKSLGWRDLKSVDIWSMVKLHSDHPELSTEQKTGIHWKDRGGDWCQMGFENRGPSGKRIDSPRRGYRWGSDWWFAGTPI